MGRSSRPTTATPSSATTAAGASTCPLSQPWQSSSRTRVGRMLQVHTMPRPARPGRSPGWAERPPHGCRGRSSRATIGPCLHAPSPSVSVLSLPSPFAQAICRGTTRPPAARTSPGGLRRRLRSANGRLGAPTVQWMAVVAVQKATPFAALTEPGRGSRAFRLRSSRPGPEGRRRWPDGSRPIDVWCVGPRRHMPGTGAPGTINNCFGVAAYSQVPRVRRVPVTGPKGPGGLIKRRVARGPVSPGV